MVKDDSLYIVAIVAVVAVVGLVIMATGSTSTVMVAEDLPSMAEDSDNSAIAGEAFRTGSSSKLYDRGYGVSGTLDYDGRYVGSSVGIISSSGIDLNTTDLNTTNKPSDISSGSKLASKKSSNENVCDSYLFTKLGCTYNAATDYCDCPDLTGEELFRVASDLE